MMTSRHEIELRRVRVGEKLLMGHDKHAIANDLGVSLTTVEADMGYITEEWKARLPEKADDVRATRLAGLEQLKQRIWAQIDVELLREYSDQKVLRSFFSELRKIEVDQTKIQGVYHSDVSVTQNFEVQMPQKFIEKSYELYTKRKSLLETMSRQRKRADDKRSDEGNEEPSENDLKE